MKLNQLLMVGGIASALLLNAGSVSAQNNNNGANGANGANGGGRQGRGNFDPAQMQKMMMDRTREQLGFTEDKEWAAVEPLVKKVMDARREASMGGGFGGGMGRPPGGRGGPQADQAGGQGGQGGGRRGGFGGEPSPEAVALQKAIDDNAPAADIKAALAKFAAAKKVKAEALASAQGDFRKVLTVKQEAQATLAGLLN
jgi:hypothetical protein